MTRLFTSHLVVCSLNVLCRAWLLLKRGFASTGAPKHPSEPWAGVVKAGWFISCAQGRDLLEPLVPGPQRTDWEHPTLQLDPLKLAWRRIVWWSSLHPALLHPDKGFTSGPSLAGHCKTSCTQTTADSRTVALGTQLVRESAAHPHADNSHRAERVW